MVSDRLSRAHLPAVLVLVVGLGIALYCGGQAYDLSRTEYTYSVSEFDGEFESVYAYSALSEESKAVTQAALNSSETTVTVSGDSSDPTPEFYVGVGSGTYYVIDGDTYYCLEFSKSASGNVQAIGGNVSVRGQEQCLQNASEDRVGFYPEYSALSEDAQAVVERAVEASGDEFTRYGSSPPEFDDGADAPSFGTGYYVVRYDGTYYQLSVLTRGGLYTGLGIFYFGVLGTFGLSIAGVGAACYLLEWRKIPTALLVGIAILGGPVVLQNVGFLADDFVGENIWLLLLCAVLIPSAVWTALTWRLGR